MDKNRRMKDSEILVKIDVANLKWIEGQTAVDRFFEKKNHSQKLNRIHSNETTGSK